MTNEGVPDLYKRLLSLSSEFFYSIEVDPDGKMSGERILGSLQSVTVMTKSMTSMAKVAAAATMRGQNQGAARGCGKSATGAGAP